MKVTSPFYNRPPIRQNRPQGQGVKMESTSFTLSFNFKEGSGPKDIAAKLRFHAGLLEGMEGKAASSRKNTDADDTAPESDDEDNKVEEQDDEEFAPKKKKAKKAAAKAFEDEEETDDAEESKDNEDEEEPPKKKSKKVTLDDVNDACRAHAKENSFEETKALLKKKFKTVSVSDLKESQYADVIKAMAV